MGGVLIDGPPLHARDHLPDGPDPIDFPAAEAAQLAYAQMTWAGVKTIAASTWTVVSTTTTDEWSSYTNPAAEVTYTGGLQALIQTDRPNDRMEFSCGDILPIFAVHGGVRIRNTIPNATGDYTVRINAEGTPMTYGPFHTMSGFFVYNHNANMEVTYIGPIDANAFVESWQIHIHHTADGSRDISEAWIIAQQLGWLDPDEGTFQP